MHNLEEVNLCYVLYLQSLYLTTPGLFAERKCIARIYEGKLVSSLNYRQFNYWTHGEQNEGLYRISHKVARGNLCMPIYIIIIYIKQPSYASKDNNSTLLSPLNHRLLAKYQNYHCCAITPAEINKWRRSIPNPSLINLKIVNRDRTTYACAKIIFFNVASIYVLI